jgi:glycosyltransferase involved in cell wall biosynthesis
LTLLPNGDDQQGGLGVPDERRALVVTTTAAESRQDNGATLRVNDVVTMLSDSGYAVRSIPHDGLARFQERQHVAVAVSYSCASTIRHLKRLAPRVWLDAVDSWLLVNASGLRSHHLSYLARGARDATRLAFMPTADLVTYISLADLTMDRGTVRGKRHLVLPGSCSASPSPLAASGRRVVLAGDWAYPPNRDGLRWFLGSVLPLLEGCVPGHDWHIALYGPHAPPAGSPRVRTHGYCPDARQLYKHGDVHVAPVPFGAGVKRKVLQPLLAGLPVVTTPSGAHGLLGHPNLSVRRGAGDFASAVRERLFGAETLSPVRPDDILDQDDSAAVRRWLRA